MPQSSKRVEQLAPELEKIIAPSEPIKDLADGFGGAQGPAEGPLWWKEGRYLLFSDIHNNKRMKYVPGGSASVVLEPTNRANDVVVKSDGCIYFTDPWTSPAAPEQWDLAFAGVYRLTPDLGTMSLLI